MAPRTQACEHTHESASLGESWGASWIGWRKRFVSNWLTAATLLPLLYDKPVHNKGALGRSRNSLRLTTSPIARLLLANSALQVETTPTAHSAALCAANDLTRAGARVICDALSLVSVVRVRGEWRVCVRVGAANCNALRVGKHAGFMKVFGLF